MERSMKCLICKSPIQQAEPAKTCEKCLNVFHQECWDDNGGCGTPGCSELPKTERKGGEPWVQSYWGATSKTCPACKETISVGLLACPYCQQSFDSECPVTTDELKGRLTGSWAHEEPRPPQIRGAVMIFVAGILGFLAPVNIIWGTLWYRRNGKALKAASAAHNLLALIGLALSGLYLILVLSWLVLRPGD
jgi:hypothetical protein